MFRKYKMKKRKKVVNPYVIFAIFVIFSLFASSGYALLSDTLIINGKANLYYYEDPNYEIGNSTYSWSLYASWGGNGTPYSYQVILNITNLDEDAVDWELRFDVPSGFLTTSNLWQAESVSLENGNTVVIRPKSWINTINHGQTLELNFIMDFENEVDLYITNLALNRKLATDINSGSGDTDSGDTGSGDT